MSALSKLGQVIAAVEAIAAETNRRIEQLMAAEARRARPYLDPNRCANGLAGYDLHSGQGYMPRNACTAQRVPGHIFCDKCREASGGYPKRRVQSRGAGQPA